MVKKTLDKWLVLSKKKYWKNGSMSKSYKINGCAFGVWSIMSISKILDNFFLVVQGH